MNGDTVSEEELTLAIDAESNCFWTDFVGCVEHCDSEPPANPIEVTDMDGGVPYNSYVAFVPPSLPVQNMVLVSIEAHYDGSDYSGCNGVGPGLPLIGKNGPFPLTRERDSHDHWVFNTGIYKSEIVGTVEGISYDTGAYYCIFTVRDLDTGIEYVGTGEYTSCS